MNGQRELDPIDTATLQNLRCPDCGKGLIAGPRGGAAQNYYCSNRDDCSQGFNLTFWLGRLVMQQRIGTVDDDRFAMYANRQ